MTVEKPPATEEEERSVVRHVDWSDFRDHIATADKEGRRQWIYPRKPRGRFYTARTVFSLLLLAIMFVGPFVRIHGNPLLMFNIVERRFSILGRMFWPQDTVVFAVAMLLFLMGIVVFTAVYGRLWCGWACPQTVLMEMVFRRIEYWIEGDAPAQKALAKAPWTGGKIAKKALKHGLFLAVSFIIGNTLLAYIIGSDAWIRLVTDNPLNHLKGLTFMGLFTLLFYSIFARFREQACTFICPYGRFQSTLIDENTIVVAYDHKRGEKRGPWRRNETPEQRAARGGGDCIDCKQCVAVCPTGIDIRNGLQMECVHCTACIDACDAVMTRIGRPRGLIRYASLNGIEKRERLRVTPRIVAYTGLLVVLAAALAVLLLTRSDVDATMLRARGTLFQKMEDGHYSNLYLLKVTNKSNEPIDVTARLERPEGELTLAGGVLHVPAADQVETSVIVELPPAALTGRKTPIEVGLYDGGKKLRRLRAEFLGPRHPPKSAP
ncbi:MAG: cytochrome c oxidase accessory protein CcoG [Verrucomicrobia bacterium]|nr:MAG: cytochrome c oxidase accessory protein CcoG [Verrucomicrobiota bacterium]